MRPALREARYDLVALGEPLLEFAGSAASRMCPADLPMNVIRDATVLHVSGVSQAISASACDSVFAAISKRRHAEAT